MFFKTLHWYVFRELLRIFVLTASALTSLMALCGVFKPFTKRGIEILQLLSIMMNLMPAMLAYAIPIAALFAAVQVYWRLSTDNELTACRASGISFVTIVIPALVLGVSVALVDLAFVNYVVPVFLERTERAILSDIGSLIVSQIGRQETVELNMKSESNQGYRIYADSAHQEPSDDPKTVIVVLEGMAATQLKDGKPSKIVIARECKVTITSGGGDDLHASFDLTDASAFAQPKLDKMTGDISSLTGLGSSGLVIPSLLKSKPKFEDIGTLKAYEANPASFPPIHDIVEKIALSLQYHQISSSYLDQWKAAHADHQKPLVVEVPGNIPGKFDLLYIYAPNAFLNAEGQLVFTGVPAKPELHQPALLVRIDQYDKDSKQLLLTHTAGEVDLNVGAVEYSTTFIAVSFTLQQDVIRTDHVNKIPPVPAEKFVNIPGKFQQILPLSSRPPDNVLLQQAKTGASDALHKQSIDADLQINKLKHTIKSELHSRGSFAVSCLTLVLFGAALGILLRGKNPLAVFVVGFVPAIFLVLLITAGRELAESPSNHTVPIGLSLIWAGNAVLLILVVSVYAKLLRH